MDRIKMPRFKYPVPPLRVAASVLLTLLLLIAQWLLRDVLQPFAGDLFYPALLLSVWIGGLWGGLLSTVVSGIAMVFVFIPPAMSWRVAQPAELVGVGIFCAVGVAFSITYDLLQRARAGLTTELGERQTLLSVMSEISHVGGWRLQLPEFRFTYTEEFARIFGFDPKDAPDPELSAGAFFKYGSRQEYLEAYRKALAEGTPYDLRLEVETPDGIHKWVRAVGRTVVKGGEVVALEGATSDITSRYEAELVTSKLSERLQLAVKAADLAVWDWDLKAGELEWDDRMYELYGRDRDTFEVTGSSWLGCVYADDRDATAESLETAISTGSPFDVQFRILYPDGSVHYIKTYSEVSRDKDGQPLRLTGVNLDITELSEAENQILDLNANLERRVEQRTAEVTAANKELEAFAYAVSHDLRAPLRAMTGFCRALEEDYGAQLDETALMYTKHISGAATNMGELIDGLLVLSRATRGDMERAEVDVSAIALTAVEGDVSAEPERDVTYEIEPGIKAFGDTRMVDALINNLIGNAWKYTKGTEHAKIRVYTERRDGHEWICVADNGAGFDSAYAEQLFVPFRRLHRQDEFPGIGIGLATVQRIINRHGGGIEAEGVVGEGATFRFWLPEG